MIQEIQKIVGKLVFFLGWPLLYLYLSGSKRTRVLVVVGEEVLVVRGWIGVGGWSLPGGGLKRNELPKNCAQRELKEETGVYVDEAKLQILINDQAFHQHGISFHIFAYVVVLDSKPDLTRQKIEISEVNWVKLQELELLAVAHNHTDTTAILRAFNKL